MYFESSRWVLDKIIEGGLISKTKNLSKHLCAYSLFFLQKSFISILFIWYLHFLWIRDFTSRIVTIKAKTFFKNKFGLFLYQIESSAAKNLNLKLPITINLSLDNSKYLKYFHFPHFFFFYCHHIYLVQWKS